MELTKQEVERRPEVDYKKYFNTVLDREMPEEKRQKTIEREIRRIKAHPSRTLYDSRKKLYEQLDMLTELQARNYKGKICGLSREIRKTCHELEEPVIRVFIVLVLVIGYLLFRLGIKNK